MLVKKDKLLRPLLCVVPVELSVHAGEKDKLLRPLLCVVPVELSVHAGEEGQVVTAVVVCGSSGAISSCW